MQLLQGSGRFGLLLSSLHRCSNIPSSEQPLVTLDRHGTTGLDELTDPGEEANVIWECVIAYGLGTGRDTKGAGGPVGQLAPYFALVVDDKGLFHAGSLAGAALVGQSTGLWEVASIAGGPLSKCDETIRQRKGRMVRAFVLILWRRGFSFYWFVPLCRVDAVR